MQTRRLMLLLASALFAALAATLSFVIPTLGEIEERWNIVVVSQALQLVKTTFIVAVAHALILGIPLFLLLRSNRPVGAISCALGGFFVGSVPFGAWALTSIFGLQNASTGGDATVVDGVPTVAGLIELTYGIGFSGVLGLAGGLTFWVAMRASDQLAVGPSGIGAQRSKSRRGPWSVVSLAAVLTGAVFLLPSIVRDNSCHNLFRDGRTSIGPQIDADVNLPAEDWPTLARMVVDFGATHSLSFRGDEKIRRGTLIWRNLSLCSEAGVNIHVIDQPWLAQLNSPIADRGLQLSLYELKLGSDWKPLARDLLNRIDTRWPGRTTFRGRNGRIVSVEEALKGRQ